jgi:predicted RNA binding protein YcfA (HicA-like mRNA interferase family)
MGGGRLPVVNGKRVIQALTKAGFTLNRIVGSHHVMTHPGDQKRTVTVPVHGARDLKAGTLRSIIRQTGLAVDDFIELL